MYLAEAPTCALYHHSHSIVTVTIRFRPIYVCVSQSLNHLRIEARTDGLLEIGSDKTHF